MENIDKIDVLVTTRSEENRNYILTVLSNEKDLRLIGFERDEAGTVIKSEKLKPDVLIIDLQPPGIDGAELAPMIRRRSPATSIILMCDRDENEYAGSALKAGVSGYLLRQSDMNKLIYAVKIVSLGGYYISASITERALDAILNTNRFSDEITDKLAEAKQKLHLSPAERSIVEGVAHGFSDNEIAEQMNLSADTIRNYISAIKQKTLFSNRVKIATYSLLLGFISPEQLILEFLKDMQNDSASVQ